MKKLKIGMISFAHQHAIGYFNSLKSNPDVILTGIADPNYDRVKEYVENTGIKYFEDYKEMLFTDVDAVVICSENVYHAQITMDAARAGKNILCEKPLGISTEEMKQMVDTCREHNVQLMTAFPCRYLRPVVEAKKALDRGEIGKIIAIKGTNRGTMPGKWFIDAALSGGGAILDHTVHLMGIYNWFLNSRPVEVYAEMGTLFNDIKVDDSGMVHVKYEDGIMAVIDTSWSRPKSFPTWGDVSMEIIGTKGVITIDSFAQKNDIYSNKNTKAQWSYWGDNMDQFLIDDFVSAILHSTPVAINGQDGINSTAVALAAYESVKENAPVRISY